MAQPPSNITVKTDLSSHAAQGLASPTSSLRTNASSVIPPGESSHAYQQFPAQAARVPAQPHVGAQDPAATSSHRPSTAPQEPRAESTAVSSTPSMVPMNENSWPAESFHDRHLSATEPRIFPGVLSRHHRRESSARAETDDHQDLVMAKKKVPVPAQTRNDVNSAVEESSEEEE